MTKTEAELRRVLAGLLRITRHTRVCRTCMAPEIAIDEPKRLTTWQRLEKEAEKLLATEHNTN